MRFEWFTFELRNLLIYLELKFHYKYILYMSKLRSSPKASPRGIKYNLHQNMKQLSKTALSVNWWDFNKQSNIFHIIIFLRKRKYLNSFPYQTLKLLLQNSFQVFDTTSSFVELHLFISFYRLSSDRIFPDTEIKSFDR